LKMTKDERNRRAVTGVNAGSLGRAGLEPFTCDSARVTKCPTP